MDVSQDKLYYYEKPIFLWVMGLLLLAFAGVMVFSSERSLFGAGLFTLFGLLVILNAPIEKITADKKEGVLTISRRTLLGKSYEEILFEDIKAINIGVSVDRDDGSKTYRVEVELKDGTLIPINKVYSGGYETFKQRAEELRNFIGIEQPAEEA